MGEPKILHHETRCRPHRRGAAVAADDQVGANLERTRLVQYARTPATRPPDSIRLVTCADIMTCKRGKAPTLVGQKIQKIPLRHQGDELARRRQPVRNPRF